MAQAARSDLYEMEDVDFFGLTLRPRPRETFCTHALDLKQYKTFGEWVEVAQLIAVFGYKLMENAGIYVCVEHFSFFRNRTLCKQTGGSPHMRLENNQVQADRGFSWSTGLRDATGTQLLPGTPQYGGGQIGPGSYVHRPQLIRVFSRLLAMLLKRKIGILWNLQETIKKKLNSSEGVDGIEELVSGGKKSHGLGWLIGRHGSSLIKTSTQAPPQTDS
ncbi:hypothetical protein POM88_027176 [Heracleum sosnowskyi]|uniref:Uncharacterized protein n=1 Tax=Heracleum sosnowskyi TaxID=360622 RepID=A0AAD8MPL8_9APIA|nr:hypothetical protein POM88_027176 [Heracleum sosnowskyi]